MKHLLLIIFITLAMTPGPGGAAENLKGFVHLPDKGVICDKKALFCADSQGISMDLTKEYLGEKAKRKMMAQINQVGSKNFDATWFTLSKGVSCKSRQNACCESKYSDKIDKKDTQVLFGLQTSGSTSTAPEKGDVGSSASAAPTLEQLRGARSGEFTVEKASSSRTVSTRAYRPWSRRPHTRGWNC